MRLSQDLAKSCLYQPYGTKQSWKKIDKIKAVQNFIKESASKRTLSGNKNKP